MTQDSIGLRRQMDAVVHESETNLIANQGFSDVPSASR